MLMLMLFISSTPHLAHEHKLVDHTQDEISPEDVQSLQHEQQCVEEIITTKGPEVFQRLHQG